MKPSASLLAFMLLGAPAQAALVPYAVVGDAIPAPLTAVPGDPARGQAIATNRTATCVLCHSGPFPGLQATIAPDLRGVGARLGEGQLRLRLVDPARLNPDTPMPSYYRVAGLVRVGAPWRDKPILNEQQIEDVVAWLATLRTPVANP